ncbi:hypothetical protein RKD42_007869 [Streptomyces ambofaciens]
MNPGPKAVREGVVRPAFGGGGGFRLVAGHAEPQVERRYGEGAQEDHRAEQHGHRAALDEAGPAGAPRTGLPDASGGTGARTPAEAAGGTRVRPLADPAGQQGVGPEAAERRDQGQGDQHREDDGAGGGQPHLRQRRHSDHRQTGQRDDDGEPGEDHRRSGRAHGQPRRLRGVVSRGALLAVAGDDQQGVVDADRDPDHHGQVGGGRGHAEGAAQRHDGGEGEGHADDGGDQRQSGGRQ